MKSISIQLVTVWGIIAGLFWICLLLPACSSDSKIAPEYPTKVPAALTKKWSSNQFPMHDFWNYTGTYPSKATQNSIAFDIRSNGNCEFYQITGQNTSGGLTEALIYQKGKVQFHSDQSFTFYPTQGNIREYMKICDTALPNSAHKATKQELTPRTFYYNFQPNEQDQLIVRANNAAVSPTTLHAANW